MDIKDSEVQLIINSRKAKFFEKLLKYQEKLHCVYVDKVSDVVESAWNEYNSNYMYWNNEEDYIKELMKRVNTLYEVKHDLNNFHLLYDGNMIDDIYTWFYSSLPRGRTYTISKTPTTFELKLDNHSITGRIGELEDFTTLLYKELDITPYNVSSVHGDYCVARAEEINKCGKVITYWNGEIERIPRNDITRPSIDPRRRAILRVDEIMRTEEK